MQLLQIHSNSSHIDYRHRSVLAHRSIVPTPLRWGTPHASPASAAAGVGAAAAAAITTVSSFPSTLPPPRPLRLDMPSCQLFTAPLGSRLHQLEWACSSSQEEEEEEEARRHLFMLCQRSAAGPSERLFLRPLHCRRHPRRILLLLPRSSSSNIIYFNFLTSIL